MLVSFDNAGEHKAAGFPELQSATDDSQTIILSAAPTVTAVCTTITELHTINPDGLRH